MKDKKSAKEWAAQISEVVKGKQKPIKSIQDLRDHHKKMSDLHMKMAMAHNEMGEDPAEEATETPEEENTEMKSEKKAKLPKGQK